MSKNKRRVCLLLTGCVNPNVKNDILAVTDSSVRRRQYGEAIRWYLYNTPYDVVFCENSGTDITSDFADIDTGGRLEILTFVKSGGGTRGKGYKEMEILEHIHDHSRLAAKAQLLVKITGRLILLNIKTIVNDLRGRRYDFVSLVHDACHRYCDSRFIFFTPQFLPILTSRKEDIKGYPINFEVVTTYAIDDARSRGFRFVFPRHAWRIHGVSGGMGIDYDTSWKQYLKADLRHQIKRPLFWLGLLPRIKQAR